MKTLREKIVNAGKSGNPEFLVLKKKKLFALRKELRKEKAALKKMENANYQCLISGIRNKYSTKKLQEQQKIIETLEIKKHKSPRKLQVFNITNKTKSKTIETKRWDLQDLDLLLMVENVIEQVVYSQSNGNLQEDLTNDLWSFWLSKKLKIISSFNQEKNHTAKFETYLYRCLKNRIIYEINHKYNNHGMIFDSETVNVAEA
ncbi:MAG: hypothetical protein HQ536_02915, partial [Parcubacteria group bacterium]|nr:hypothetical protein [Parcubacteria group bacterium]